MVLGCPRSGTSTVARLLHTKMGVCMGHHIDNDLGGLNPGGSYEDRLLAPACDALALGHITPRLYRIRLEEYHKEKGCTVETIGIKHPRLSLVSPAVLMGTGPSRVFITNRQPPEVHIASLVRFFTERLVRDIHDLIRDLSAEEKAKFIARCARETYDSYAAALFLFEGATMVTIGPGRTNDGEVLRQMGADM